MMHLLKAKFADYEDLDNAFESGNVGVTTFAIRSAIFILGSLIPDMGFISFASGIYYILWIIFCIAEISLHHWRPTAI